METIRDRAAWQVGRGLYAALTRRDVLRAAAGAAASMGLPFGMGGRAGAATTLKFSITTGVHEMAIYFIPDSLPSEYQIEWVHLGTAGISVLAAMLQGQIHFMTNANSYLVSARAQGGQLTAISGLAGRGQGIVARADRGIRRLEDLRGKKLATKKLTSSHVMLMLVLRALGIDPNKDVEIVDVGEPAAFSVMIQRGQVDAGQLWEPHISIAASQPGISKLELDRFFKLTWVTHSSLIAAQKTIEERPEVVQAVVNANVKATAQMKKERDRWLKFAQKYVTQPPEILQPAMDNSDPRPDFDLTMLYRNAETMLELGVIKKDVTREMEEAVDYRFLERATGKKREALGFVSYADYKQGKRYAPA
jgi:NitT/TauT family transport system substrate-binding protein